MRTAKMHVSCIRNISLRISTRTRAILAKVCNHFLGYSEADDTIEPLDRETPRTFQFTVHKAILPHFKLNNFYNK
jgi:hypothetical protein